jgi:hypothetical protein
MPQTRIKLRDSRVFAKRLENEKYKQGKKIKFANASLADDSLGDCPKLGVWQKRMNHLLADLDRMQAVCDKKAQEAQYGGGSPY